MVFSLLVYERRQHHHPAHQPPPPPAAAAPEAPSGQLTRHVQAAVKAVKGALHREVFFHHNLALSLVAVALAVLAEALWWRDGGGGQGRFREVAGAAGACAWLFIVGWVVGWVGWQRKAPSIIFHSTATLFNQTHA